LGEAEKKIKEVNEAFEILSDEVKKREYDSGENVVVENYGYDYEEKVLSGESALEKYVGVKGDNN
jgi:curved DNA-binding protein CbpA